MAFTLIELLVVIGIITLLIMLSFPAYKRAKETAAMSKCAGNLRQIGMAAFQFANDHDGRLLTWGKDVFDPFSPRWPQGLAPTLGDTDENAQWTSAVLNRIYKPLACPATPQQYAWPGGPNPPYTINYAANCFGRGYLPMKLLQCSHPASTIYLMDGKAIVNSNPALTADVADPGWPPSPANQGVYFPHGGRCNAFFLDGHVESFSKSILLRYFQP